MARRKPKSDKLNPNFQGFESAVEIIFFPILVLHNPDYNNK